MPFVQNQQEPESVDTQDNAKPCREKVQAGKGKEYQGKCEFQDQALVKIYKNIYMWSHTKKPKMSIGITNHLPII